LIYKWFVTTIIVHKTYTFRSISWWFSFFLLFFLVSLILLKFLQYNKTCQIGIHFDPAGEEKFCKLNNSAKKNINSLKYIVNVAKRLDELVQKLKDELGLFLSISFGVFLFVLFFQPFPFISTDFNNILLIIAGLGGIVFLFMVLVRTVLPWIFDRDPEKKDPLFPSYFNGFMMVVLSTLAFVFYIRYVGSVEITFHITFKVVIICLTPAVVLGLHDTFKTLKEYNDLLISEKKKIQKQIEKYEEDLLNKSIEFVSENISENLTLQIGEVVFMKSADNYVEIVYKEGDIFKKKLIRNTLKNIELQIKQYTNFVRCHRTCIVNVHFIGKLIRDANNHWLSIKGFDEELPVSRQYLLKVKEAL
jgi:DNA-binding LytR/AlgR family response regulator